MKELLQLVIDLVKELPELAIWVLLILFMYKAVVIGSVYSIIRMAITKVYEAFTAARAHPRVIQHEWKLESMTCYCKPELEAQLRRIQTSGGMIHKSCVNKLAKALDDYEIKNGELS